MKYLDLTLPTPEENLACDEALLDQCDQEDGGEILRVWRPLTYFVVLGYSNQYKTETDFEACKKDHIPVLRRTSGGGTVLQGPGCLNYSLVLNISKTPSLANILSTTRYILERNQKILEPVLQRPIEIQGISDLALNDLKFSGNAQRRKRHAILFHGTFLCDFDLPLISRYLKAPSRQPEYRNNRSHADFLINIETDYSLIQAALKKTWRAQENFEEVPFPQIRSLVEEKYSLKSWNQKF